MNVKHPADQQIESDGNYHLSGQIINVLKNLGKFRKKFNKSDKNLDEYTIYTEYIYEIFRGVTTKQHSIMECLKGANRDGAFLKEEYQKRNYNKNKIKDDINERINNLRSLLDLAQNASSIIDRALDQNLDLGKKIRDDAIDEIICLKNLEQNYNSIFSW